MAELSKFIFCCCMQELLLTLLSQIQFCCLFCVFHCPSHTVSTLFMFKVISMSNNQDFQTLYKIYFDFCCSQFYFIFAGCSCTVDERLRSVCARTCWCDTNAYEDRKENARKPYIPDIAIEFFL